MTAGACTLDDEVANERPYGCYSKCHASRGDGECNWRGCPQKKNYKRHCPLDFICAIHGEGHDHRRR